jgi:hypothetical protein
MGNAPTIDFKMNANYFGLAFSGSDKLRLILAPCAIIELTEQKICCLLKIQKIKASEDMTEFKLEGNPVGDSNKTRLVDFKLLMTVLIENYYNSGWHIKSNICLDTYGKNGSTIIFEKNEPLKTMVSCLSFDEMARLCVFGSQEFLDKIKEILWAEIERKNFFSKHWVTFKINENYSITEMISELFKSLYEIGWIYCGSIQTHSTEMSSLYFRYEEKLAPIHEFFALDIRKSDTISIYNPPPFMIEQIRNTIELEWSKGIQNEKLKSNVYEFKLNGTPWLNKMDSLLESRRLLNKIIQNLSKSNYDIYSICDLSTSEYKTSTFYFSKTTKLNQVSDSTHKIMSLSLYESDKLRIIDDLGEFSNILRRSIGQVWPKGLNLESNDSDAIEFKLNGSPFSPFSSTNDTINFSMLILVLFENMKKLNQLKFIGSADLCSEYISIENIPYGFNIHTLFFQFDQ